MAVLIPFRGLSYSPEVAGDIGEAISPPFDTISPELQESLYQRSPHNVVRLEAGQSRATDGPGDDRYSRAAATLKDWMARGVLRRDTEASFYLVRHSFGFRGADRERIELMACVGLEEYFQGMVLPHEFTRADDKSDRLALLQACRANFSPIMGLYRDPEKRLPAIFRSAMAGPPLMEMSDAAEQGYTVWRIDRTGWINEIKEAIAPRPLYIADGHHRYETALNFRNLSRSGIEESWAGDEPSNFVMMGLIDFDDPGLLVLPYHRVARGLGDAALDRVRGDLARFFHRQPFGNEDQPPSYTRLLEEVEAQGKDKVVMGLLDPKGSGLELLTLKPEAAQEEWGLLGDSEAWVLEEQVLRPILGESLGRCISYVHDGDEAAESVRSGQYELGFFLRPFPLGLFETIVKAGHRLPPKSTFFYPKLPAGLVINLLNGDV